MLSRSTRWSFKLVTLCVLTLPGIAQAEEPDYLMSAPHYISEEGFTVIKIAPPGPLPEVTVVAPSEPLPVHEVVVAPIVVKPLIGEDLVFAQIQRDQELGVELDILPEEAPGPELTPPAPFGTHRNVIEL